MSSPEINRILGARVVGPQTVELRFGDGFVASLDLTLALWGPVFSPLKNPAHFRQLHLEDDTIRWPCGADLCPDVLRYWCETGGVRTQEQTDAHFAAQLAAPAAS